MVGVTKSISSHKRLLCYKAKAGFIWVLGEMEDSIISHFPRVFVDTEGIVYFYISFCH